MKIGVDAGCLGIADERLKVGVYTVVKNMLLELSKIDTKNQYYLYSFYPIEKSLMGKLGKSMKNIVLTPARGWLKIALPLRLLIDKVDVFIAANQAMPVRLPFSKYQTIGIFYDIAFEKYPELYAYAANVTKHKKNSRKLAKEADKIIAISETTKKDIEVLYHVTPEKIIVAYPGKDEVVKIKAFKNKLPYFLFVGAFKKSKNIPFLLNSFAKFTKDTHLDYDLFLVGGDKWIDPEIQQTLQTFPEEIRKKIKLLGFVENQQLAALYRGAYAFISPSLYEGFGLPFIEAQSVGLPVIGSRNGSMQEILGKSGLFVDPNDTNTLASAMTRLVTNKKLHQQVSLAGKENAGKYSWKLFAKKIQLLTEQR